MNNFNDYYNYMIGNQPSNMYNNNFDNNTFQNTFMNLDNSPKLYNPNEGFTKGNMFMDLYSQYKNYKPMTIVANSEKENLMNQIQMYDFAINDLNLYLDLDPKNSNIIKLYNDYLRKSKELTNHYERIYGPISNDSMSINTTEWDWYKSPWPWEVIR